MLPASVRGTADAPAGHDLVLVVGAPVFRCHQHAPGDHLPAGTRLLHLTGDPGQAARAPMGRAVVVDVADALPRPADGVTAGRRGQLPPLPPFREPPRSGARTHPEELFAVQREHAPADTAHVESTATNAAETELTEP